MFFFFRNNKQELFELKVRIIPNYGILHWIYLLNPPGKLLKSMLCLTSTATTKHCVSNMHKNRTKKHDILREKKLNSQRHLCLRSSIASRFSLPMPFAGATDLDGGLQNQIRVYESLLKILQLLHLCFSF